jgi:hypothetical protein
MIQGGDPTLYYPGKFPSDLVIIDKYSISFCIESGLNIRTPSFLWKQ